MNKIIKIEHNNERVLTTEQLAQAYECDISNIQDNYRKNQSRFEEGIHFFKLNGDELKDFKSRLPENFRSAMKFAPNIMLWTRRGASRHSKMLGTDKAWDMFDKLEDVYFNSNKPIQLPQNYLAALESLVETEKAKQAAEQKVAQLQPKADFYDTVASSESLLSMADVAKVLDKGIGRNRLFKLLRSRGILQSNNVPYQRFVDAGYFKVVESSYMAGDNAIISTVTYVKQKGVDYIRKLLEGGR